MISFWHISAVCCVPKLNPDRRTREQEIFLEVANDTSRVFKANGPKVRGRWERRELVLVGQD